MLAMLLESRARSPRRRVATLSSITGHVAFLLALVMSRAEGNPSTVAEPRETRVVYFPPTPPQAAPTRVITPASTMPSTQYALPQVDLAPIAVERTPLDVATAVALAPNTFVFAANAIVAPPTAPADSSGVLTRLTVDVPVELIAGQRPPRYPLALERAGVSGDVTAQFVVDTAGRVERGSIAILHASHTEFANAVRERLSALRFAPARAQGRLVRQLVEQRFAFEVPR